MTSIRDSTDLWVGNVRKCFSKAKIGDRIGVYLEDSYPSAGCCQSKLALVLEVLRLWMSHAKGPLNFCLYRSAVMQKAFGNHWYNSSSSPPAIIVARPVVEEKHNTMPWP